MESILELADAEMDADTTERERQEIGERKQPRVAENRGTQANLYLLRQQILAKPTVVWWRQAATQSDGVFITPAVRRRSPEPLSVPVR